MLGFVWFKNLLGVWFLWSGKLYHFATLQGFHQHPTRGFQSFSLAPHSISLLTSLLTTTYCLQGFKSLTITHTIEQAKYNFFKVVVNCSDFVLGI